MMDTMVKMFWKCAHRVFSTARMATCWPSERMLDCQLCCSRRTGWDPFLSGMFWYNDIVKGDVNER